MDRRQRIEMQRVLVREALGKLRAAEELFGIEDGCVAGDDDSGFDHFNAGVNDFEIWLFDESPIA